MMDHSDGVAWPGGAGRVQWRTDRMRFTVFTKDSGRFARDWWVAATGSPPDSVHEEPQKGTVVLKTVEGNGRSMLHAMAAQDRFDIRRIFAKPGREFQELPLFENNIVSTFRDLCVRAIKLIVTQPNPVTRLAFAARMAEPSATLDGCRTTLDSSLPPNIQAEELRDFFYRVNSRRWSRVISGMEINRVVNWSILVVQDISVSASDISNIRKGKPAWITQFHLDINSAPEYGEHLLPHRLAPLLEEFTTEAITLTSAGDNRVRHH